MVGVSTKSNCFVRLKSKEIIIGHAQTSAKELKGQPKNWPMGDKIKQK